ncbi:MAG: hypothetical protein EAX90_11420 [Candidatus Heimdallarchaeota archaeon]|nr:hypothetical protein [Candidatus Heimdallarchaeota archaeon]
MRFEKFGKINPSKKYTFNPLKQLENSTFKRLNFLLGFIEGKSKEVHQKYIHQLIETFEDLVKIKTTKHQPITDILEKYPNLKNLNNLANLYFQYFLDTINKTSDEITYQTELQIPSKIYWQLSFGIIYYEALALTKAMDREEAINLFKEYLDEYYVFIESTFTKFETLDEVRDSHIKDAQRSTDGEFVAIYSTVEEGKYIIRNDNCPAVEALKDREDRELIYLVCCYADFQYAKMTNEDFRMTRFYTVAENDPYCDKVFHDIRISNKLEHPSTELIDSMGPLSKEHWRKDYFRK